MRGLRKMAPSLDNWVAVYPINRGKELRDRGEMEVEYMYWLGTSLYPFWPANKELSNF